MVSIALSVLTAVAGAVLVVAATPVGAGRAEVDTSAGTGMASLHGEPGRSTSQRRSLGWLPGASQVRAEWIADPHVPDAQALQLRLSGPDGDDSWLFAAPPGERLVTRTYTHARGGSFERQEVTARMQIGHHCTNGSFTVHELADDLSRVWITFRFGCPGTPERQFGEVRVGTPTTAGPTTSSSQVSWPGTPVGLTGAAITVLARNDSEFVAPLTAVLGQGDDAFDLLGDDCGEVQPGAWCRIRVRFRPTVAGELARSLRIEGPGGDSTVRLAGDGWGGATSYRHRFEVIHVLYRPADSDIAVSGDRENVYFSAERGETVHRGSGGLHVRGGIEPGRTYSTDQTGVSFSFASTNTSDRCEQAVGAVDVHEATWGRDGDLTSVSLTWKRCGATGALSWRARHDRPAPAIPTPALGPPAAVRIRPSVDGAYLTWGTPYFNTSTFENVIRVRRLGPSGPTLVRSLSTSVGRAVDLGHLPPGHDYEVAMALVRQDVVGQVGTRILRGTRIAAVQVPDLRRGQALVKGRLVDVRDRPISGQFVTVVVTRKDGRRETSQRPTAPGGTFALSVNGRPGDSVQFTFSGLMDPLLLGSTTGSVVLRNAR